MFPPCPSENWSNVLEQVEQWVLNVITLLLKYIGVVKGIEEKHWQTIKTEKRGNIVQTKIKEEKLG